MWNDIGKVCGSGFTSSITAQAGNKISSGAGRKAVVSLATVGTVALAVFFF